MVKFWKTMGVVGGISTITLLIGGINWLTIGLARYIALPNGGNFVNGIFGGTLDSIIYILVGLSAIYSIYALFIKKGK